ncbi:MAG: hypothetical protein ABJA98_32050 [Acidobacteriota bacterium]
MPALSPIRPISPWLLYKVEIHRANKRALAAAAGFPHYIYLYLALRDDTVRASPLMVRRLQRLADIVGFPKEQIFLDEVTK